ncbi:MAG: hypothetical protein ACXAC6_03695 [Candidatus Hodarchaeales archaeon]|jgi:hypothetical protein
MSRTKILEDVQLPEPNKILPLSNIPQKLKYRKKAMQKDPNHEKLLQGTTLQVYWFLLTHPDGIAGIREIQKALKLSSPGLVSYHINNLISVGIIAKNNDNDKYYVKEEVKSGILGFYFRLGYRIVPRFSIYLIIFIVCLIIFVLFMIDRGDAYILDSSNWVFLFVLIFGTIVFMYESLKIWKMKP